VPGQVDRDHLDLGGVQLLDHLREHLKLGAKRVNEHNGVAGLARR